MPKIKYIKTSFRVPGMLTQLEYLKLKNQLSVNPSTQLDTNFESFFEHFKTMYVFFTIGLISLLGVALFQGTFMVAVFGLSSFIGCGVGLLGLVLEGPSYSTYLKDRKNYFERLKYFIVNSNSYSEFIEQSYK